MCSHLLYVLLYILHRKWVKAKESEVEKVIIHIISLSENIQNRSDRLKHDTGFSNKCSAYLTAVLLVGWQNMN